MATRTPTKATAAVSSPATGGGTRKPKTTLTIQVECGTACRPNPEQDLMVRVGYDELELTECDDGYICTFDDAAGAPVTFEVSANSFSCEEDGFTYQPEFASKRVDVKAGSSATLPINYESIPPNLRIKIEGTTDNGSGTVCLPTIDEHVQLFNGANEQLKLARGGDDFVYNLLPADADSSVLNVVAKPFNCEHSTGRICKSFEPEDDRFAIRVSRDCASELTLTYYLGRSSIQVTPKLGTTPVPNVRFSVFDGADATGCPLVRVSSLRNPTVSFAHLQSEVVTIVVDPPSSLGNQNVELANPKNRELRVILGAGSPADRPVDLSEQYQFVAVTSTVSVQVVEHPFDEPVAGISVRLVALSNGTGAQPTAESGTDGRAEFTMVAAGTYSVELATEPTIAAGRTWTAAYQTPPTVTVTDADSVITTELPLMEEPHIVQGTVFGTDGNPEALALVEVRPTADESVDPIIVQANEDGHYEWEAPAAGTYYLTLAKQNGFVRVSINSTANQDLHQLRENGFGGSAPGGEDGDRDLTPFPLLVGNVELGEGTAPTSAAGSGNGGTQSAGATVSAAIRDVLGYRTRTTDTKGFIAALQRSFTCVEKPGYTHCEWTPRSYAATIPADLGALTGAQASVFERARASADAIVPLLDGLGTLSSDADDEDERSIKSIVRSRITEIVNELSLEGGPRTQRVDELFERLTGYRRQPGTGVVFFNITTLKGELRKLGQRLGMKRRNVNTIAEEENFTNFLIIVDTVATLFAIWQQAKGFFVRDGIDDPTTEQDAPFLGTQLVLISRQLGVVAETVQESYFAMDSVFLGPAERQTVLLSLDEEGGVVIQDSAHKTAMLLSELLDWIDRFCTDEGPQLIEEAGTDGVNAFVPTVRRLSRLTKSASQQSNSDAQLPPSFFTRRVQLALAQLASQLARAATLADAVFERLNLSNDERSDSDSQQGGWR